MRTKSIKAIKKAKAETGELFRFGDNWKYAFKTGDNWQESYPQPYFTARNSRRTHLITTALACLLPEDEQYKAEIASQHDNGLGDWQEFVRNHPFAK